MKITMTQQLNYFVVDTRGHCFICLTQTALPSHQLTSRELIKEKSVYSLSRYLKLDMSKVFHEKESIPSELLENVKRSRLKVALCEKCSKWNDKISALCRQLEKIETEVTSYLQLVLGGLLRSSGDDKTDLFSDNDSNFNLGWMEKGRIVKALRAEAMERCSRKIKSAKPRVKLQKLTDNQVVLKQQRIKFNYFREQHQISSNIPGHEDSMKCSISSMDVDQAKIENYDVSGGSDHYFEDAVAVEYGGTEISQDEESNNEGEMEDDRCLLQNTKTTAAKKLNFVVNPETGKFKCNLCGKEFSLRRNLPRHHQSAHIGVRFKCDLCGKCFTQLKSLSEHQQSVHLGQRFQCKLCSMSFSRKFRMAAHLRSEHPQ